MFGMLTSCAAGVTVVNIDNGFGAAMAAVRLVESERTKERA
jgi:NCAIR mutase (PurE)-related protein